MKRFFSPTTIVKLGKTYLKNRWRGWRKREVFQGELERIEDNCLIGWVYDSNHPDRPVEFSLWVDSEQVGRGMAAWPRSTVPYKGGIQFPLPKAVLDGKRHSFQLGLVPSGTRFPQTPVLLSADRSPEPIPETSSSTHRYKGVIGGIEYVGAGKVTGWVFDLERPDTPLPLCLLVDGKEVGWTLANLYRDELRSVNLGDGRKGFHFTVPMYLRNGRDHRLQLRVLGRDLYLPQQPISKTLSSASSEDERDRYCGFIQLQGDQLVGEVGDRFQADLPIPIEIVLNNRARAFITPCVAVDRSKRPLCHPFEVPVKKFLEDGEQLRSVAFRIAGTDTCIADSNSPSEFLAIGRQCPKAEGKKPRLSIIAWDATHNPLGRAFILAEMMRNDFEVEIVAPMFPQYGTDIWEPLRQSPVPIRTFWGRRFPEHFEDLSTIAAAIETDCVWVSKPRLPSLELGFLVRMGTGD